MQTNLADTPKFKAFYDACETTFAVKVPDATQNEPESEAQAIAPKSDDGNAD